MPSNLAPVGREQCGIYGSRPNVADHNNPNWTVDMRYLIISAIFLAAWPLHARDKVDVLVMNNGDRLTCEIKSLSSGALYVGLDYVQGTVQVDWSKVHHV